VGLNITPAGRDALLAVRQRRNDWLAGRLEALGADGRAALDAAVAPLAQIIGEAE
jgi:hypothetical protein